MKYHQKDIVEIDFPIPGEGYKVHPALIVSNDDLQLDEGFVYVALKNQGDRSLILCSVTGASKMGKSSTTAITSKTAIPRSSSTMRP